MDPLATIFAGGTILFLVGYVFAPHIVSWAQARARRRHPEDTERPQEEQVSPEPPPLIRRRRLDNDRTRRTRPTRSKIQLRDAMAVLFSAVFGLWALYVLTAHPDSIVHGPKYDSATKQAATGVIGAISGLWIGRVAE